MKQKPKDLIVILIIYMIALGAAVLTLMYAPIENILWKTALADVVATAVVFIFSMIYNNTSVYDPYWSAAPIFIVLYWLIKADNPDFFFKAIWILVVLWGVRLTWNWILRWDGMKDEDWRYVKFRKSSPKLYWVISFFGLQMMPTLWVFMGLVPVYYAIQGEVSWLDSWLGVIAFVFTLSAIMLEKAADDQLRHYLKNRKDRSEHIQSPLWVMMKYPNYIGEMLFWWGLFLCAIAVDRGLWWTVFGPASITILFVFISIPMMARRLSNRR